MRSISASLLTAQQAASRTPYIKMVFTDTATGLVTHDLSTDGATYGNMIVLIDHQEEAYNEYATVILREKGSTTVLPDLTGFWTEIGYGLTTGSGNEYTGTQTSRLWVKHQRHITAGGSLLTVLELEGMWSKMREGLLDLGVAPYYANSYNGSTYSVYDIMDAVLAAYGINLDALTVDDGIIDTFLPVFDINKQPYEMGAGVLYRLIRTTKCYLRSGMTNAMKLLYPQAADAVDYSYNAIVAPNFYSYMHRAPTLTPNRFVCYGYRNTDGSWSTPPMITSEVTSAADVAKYYAVTDIALFPDLTSQAMLDLICAARLGRARMEQDIGLAVVPHDGRIELYDKLTFVDDRAAVSVTYPTDTVARVCGLHHIYKPGQYKLEIYVGGVSNTAWDSYTADEVISGRISTGQQETRPEILLWPEPTKWPQGVTPTSPVNAGQTQQQMIDFANAQANYLIDEAVQAEKARQQQADYATRRQAVQPQSDAPKVFQFMYDIINTVNTSVESAWNWLTGWWK